MGLPHVICMAAPPQFNANAQLVCLNGQQSQAIDTFLNASSTDDGQVGTPYRVYLWHYLYVIQLAVFKFFIASCGGQYQPERLALQLQTSSF